MTDSIREPITMNLIADVRWEDREKAFVARVEEFPNLQGLGKTPRQAAEELYEAIHIWMDLLKRSGKRPGE